MLVSLLIYLDKEWPLGHDAETLFLDTPTDTGELITLYPEPSEESRSQGVCASAERNKRTVDLFVCRMAQKGTASYTKQKRVCMHAYYA